MIRKSPYVFTVLAIFFALCYSSAASQSVNAATSSYTITDQLGRTVTLPKKIERIVCLQHHSLDILLELQANDKIVGVMSNWESLLGNYVVDIFPKIKSVSVPGSLKEANVEAIAVLKPDVVIASNQLPKEIIAQLEALNIPAVVVSLYVADKEQASTIHPDLVNPDEAYTEGLRWAVETLGKIAGKEEKASELWDYVIQNRKIVAQHLADVPEEQRIRVYMANENMNTYGTGKYVGVAMEKAGAKNVAETIKGYQQVTVEQVASWNPSVIFVQSRYASVLDDIKADKAWAEIDAVKNGRLLIAPDYTKPWGNPTPESIALGEIWLAKTLYPDVFKDVNLDEMVQYFYKNFYGVDFKG